MIKRLFFLIALIGISFSSFADEGMWLPLHIKRLNQANMEKMGLKLTADEIYSVNNSSLKDAIVSLGGFCTAEVISKEGLLLTNHHCAYGSIQSHSSVENDYLTDGFWAMSKEDEKPNEGLYARFLVRMEDVSARVLKNVNDKMSEDERNGIIGKEIKEIEKEAKGTTHYDTQVKAFFDGNEYYLFVYETYKDVRLVGAPPSSIGKFGGDTDNWMWPRHTGDFALYRVYMSPDGKPADYSPNNVPLKPKHHLPISLDGVQEGDFSMVMGYPGSTDRYLTSYGIKLALDITNPTRVDIRDKRLKTWKKDMDADKDIKIKYASKYASVSNYWKYFIGQSRGLQNLNVYGKKKKIEADFDRWVKADSKRQELYGNVLADIEKSYTDIEKYNKSYVYLLEAALGTEIISFSYGFNGLYKALKENTEKAKVDPMIAALKDRAGKHYKNYNVATDKKVFTALLRMFYENAPQDQHPAIFAEVQKKYKGNFSKWADNVYAKSVFANADKLEAFLNNPTLKVIETDPAFVAAQSFIDNYNNNISPKIKDAYAKLTVSNRLFVRGLREMNPDKNYYPNANSTMRLTYGQVLSYEPQDGVTYKYYTTLDGKLAKENPDDDEFIVPGKIRELYEAKDYGRYADKNGKLVVGFITNNDITGGNSGSPVINGKGHLIGTAFDGNWEAMSGDIAFETELQRCINVDIRYTLWVIDKFAGAGHLINEMTIIQNSPVTEKADAGKKELMKN
jgi:hypothetical protein